MKDVHTPDTYITTILLGKPIQHPQTRRRSLTKIALLNPKPVQVLPSSALAAAAAAKGGGAAGACLVRLSGSGAGALRFLVFLARFRVSALRFKFFCKGLLWDASKGLGCSG